MSAPIAMALGLLLGLLTALAAMAIVKATQSATYRRTKEEAAGTFDRQRQSPINH